VRISRLAPLALTTALAVSGSCSAGDPPVVDRADVEEQVSTQLGEQAGREPEAVECPEDLEGEVDTTMTCVLRDGGQEYDVTVTVTEVEGTRVDFHIEVGSGQGDDEGTAS
jgi:hypothetical protein